MIKANELRIGNWVMETIYDFDPKIIKFCSVNFTQPEDYYSPIPLTPEILEKAGFYEEDGCFHASRRYDFELYFNPDLGDYRYRRVDGGATSVTTLHQLQNLYFALTGEELNIEL